MSGPDAHYDRQPCGKVDIPADWLAEFEAAARRPLETRMRYAFIRTYKPVLDYARQGNPPECPLAKGGGIRPPSFPRRG